MQNSQVKSSVTQDCPLLIPVLSSGFPVAYKPVQLGYNWAFPWPALHVWSFAITSHRHETLYLQKKHCLCLLIYHKGYTLGKAKREVRTLHIYFIYILYIFHIYICIWNFQILSKYSTSQHIHTITNLEALQTPSFWIFIEATLCRQDWLYQWALVVKPVSRPSTLPF